MKRTQIQLSEEVFELLRSKAFREKRSIASIVRDTLQRHIHVPAKEKSRKLTSFTFIGSGRSRGKDSGYISRRHDKELADIL